MVDAVFIYLLFGLLFFAIGIFITIAVIKSAINNSELNENVKAILEILREQNLSSIKSYDKGKSDPLTLSKNYKDNVDDK